MNRDETLQALYDQQRDHPALGPLSALLAPDSPLAWHMLDPTTGDVIDVRAALADYWRYTRALGAISDAENLAWLMEKRQIPGPLADLCRRLAEESV